MLASQALIGLTRSLATSLQAMEISSSQFGHPELVEKKALEAEKLFQGYAKFKPSKEDSYFAALAFLRNQELDDWQRDQVAASLSEPIREQSGATILGSKRFPSLLSKYEEEAKAGNLWRLTWHGLLYSYFSFDLSKQLDGSVRENWQTLRKFLERTWQLVDKQSGKQFVPDWVVVLRCEKDVLSENPVEKYAKAYLEGQTETVEKLAVDLGIPPSSWFWDGLVLEAVRKATESTEQVFRALIPRLIELIESKPAFRDDAIELILKTIHEGGGSPDERMRDFVVRTDVWKNPKLKDAGIATAWNRVSEPIYRMVLSWINEGNLRDFFDILAARGQADSGRLAFWSKYIKQISWTRLVFGADTMRLQKSNTRIRDLIAREQGAYAKLTAKVDVDAFMMQIGKFLIVEFSKTGSACYVYPSASVPFEPYSHSYTGTTSDLAIGFHKGASERIVHRADWAYDAAQKLRKLGIIPDKPDSNQNSSYSGRGSTSASSKTTNSVILDAIKTIQATNTSSTKVRPPPGAQFTMEELEWLVRKSPGAEVDDRRGPSGGRLWVLDKFQNAHLARELKKLGFRWAASTCSWYFPPS